MQRSLCLQALAGIIAIAILIPKQVYGEPPAFEVASLKAVQLTTGTYRANLGTARHGQVTLTNVTLSDCLKYAFGITNDSQISGPDWIRSKEVRFNVVGKAAPDTPSDRLLVMLQTLLTERFKLQLHREPRERSFLALVVRKKGPKLHEAQTGSDASANKRGGKPLARTVAPRISQAEPRL